jgi:hypothetical protein
MLRIDVADLKAMSADEKEADKLMMPLEQYRQIKA